MEEKIFDCLQDMRTSIKQVETFRATHGIKPDSKTKRLHTQVLERLKSMDAAIERSLMGIV